MKTVKLILTILIILMFKNQITGQDFKLLIDPAGVTGINANNGIEKPVTIKVFYDNYSKVDGLVPGWGYSIVIEGLEKYVLFDAGADPDIF